MQLHENFILKPSDPIKIPYKFKINIYNHDNMAHLHVQISKVHVVVKKTGAKKVRQTDR